LRSAQGLKVRLSDVRREKVSSEGPPPDEDLNCVPFPDQLDGIRGGTGQRRQQKTK